MKKSLFSAQPLTNRAARRAHLREAAALVRRNARAEVVQEAQGRARVAMFKAYGTQDVQAVALAIRNYDATVAELEALLGPDAECYEVDCDLWSNYNDWFKSENGVRPRFYITRASVLADYRKDAKPFTVGMAEKYGHHEAPILRPDGTKAPKRLPINEVYREWMGCIAA